MVQGIDRDGNEMWTLSCEATALFVSPERHGIEVPMDQTDLLFQLAQQGNQTR